MPKMADFLIFTSRDAVRLFKIPTAVFEQNPGGKLLGERGKATIFEQNAVGKLLGERGKALALARKFIVSQIAKADSIACAQSLTSFLQLKCDSTLLNFEPV